MKQRETSFMNHPHQRPPLKFGASLDQGKLMYSDQHPPQRILPKSKRPPLLHSACFDQSVDFEFTSRPPPILNRSGYRQKPLSAEEPSVLIEEENTSMFGSTKFLSKSDECCLIDRNNSEEQASSVTTSELTNQKRVTINNNHNNNRILKTQFSIDLPENVTSVTESVSASYERNYRNRANEYFYERAAAGPSNMDYNEELELIESPKPSTVTTTAIVHNNSTEETTTTESTTESIIFRPNRLQALSGRITPKLVKQNRVQRLSSSSLQVQTTKETSLTRLFDKRFGRKNNRLEKSKRLSTSALYDQSPTEILYKSKSGSNRLSSVQLFEKFCSEDFGSLYGNSNTPTTTDTDEYYDYYNNYNYYEDPTTSKSEDSVTYFNFYENPPLLDRASVTALYERFCYDDNLRQTSSSQSSHDTTGTGTSSSGAIRKQTPSRDQDNVFTFDTPPTPITKRKSIYSDTTDTPALSRGSETETSFNDDFISSFNDDFYISSITEDNNMLMSPNLETLIEDTPKIEFDEDSSEPTQIITDNEPKLFEPDDQYEPCFAVCLQPKRRSIKKIMLPNFKDRSWDLSNLDLRPIDDDGDSDDDYETSHILESSVTSKSYLANIDETNSIENNHSNADDDSVKLISKSSTEEPTSISSRLSMHKLQPLQLKIGNESENTTKSIELNSMNNSGTINNSHLSMSDPAVKVTTPPTNVKSSDKSSVFFRVGRDKHNSAVTVHRKTKCFPL